MFNRNPLFRITSLVTLTLGLCSHAFADASEALELSAFENEPGGPQTLSGQFMEAAEIIEQRISRLHSTDKLVAFNNLCVARTMMREFEAAIAACDRAVKQARHLSSTRRTNDRSAHVKALNNRGVLNVLRGSPDAAISDLGRAANMSIDPDLSAPERNLTYIRSLSDQSIAGTN